MAKVILGSTVSLDGYIDHRNGSVEAPYSDLGDWRETDPGKESIQNTGAVVMGRNSYAMAEDPDRFAGNYEYQVPFGRRKRQQMPGMSISSARQALYGSLWKRDSLNRFNWKESK